MPYNAPLCYSKAGNGVFRQRIKDAVFEPKQQRAFLPFIFQSLELITHKLPEVSEAR